MNISFDPASNIPAYMQLYSRLREDIKAGVYPYDAKLPSKRLLADEAKVSVITVEHAYGILADEGYIVSRQRSGYFVSYRQSDYLAIGSPSPARAHTLPALCREDGSFPYSVLAKTMRRVLSQYGEAILIKSPNRGCVLLREAICAYLARSRGMSAEPGQIVVGSGAEYIYGLVVNLLGRERTYAIESPSYEKIERVYRASGAHCELLKLGSDGIISSELERTSATALHVTPYNSFPSSVTASASKRAEYVRWALARGGFIIEDDYCSEFTVSSKVEDTVYSLEPQNTVIYINSFSKTVAPSIRIGYMVLPKGLMDKFDEKIGFFSCTVPLFEQYVLAELINNGDFERHINRIRRRLRRAAAH